MLVGSLDRFEDAVLAEGDSCRADGTSLLTQRRGRCVVYCACGSRLVLEHDLETVIHARCGDGDTHFDILYDQL